MNVLCTFNLSGVTTAGAQPEIFQGREGFVELGHSDKHFVKRSKKKKKARREKFFVS